MRQFILVCRDKPESFVLRADFRGEHLDYIKNTGDRVLLAGPMLDDQERSIGSVLIIEAEDLSAAQKFAGNDPYAKAGLFSETEIHPYKIVMANLLADRQ